jgi:hypothetical protein
LWAKGLNAKDIYKEMLPVYIGKFLLHKAFHNWIDNFSQGHSKVADEERSGAEATEATVKRFLC